MPFMLFDNALSVKTNLAQGSGRSLCSPSMISDPASSDCLPNEASPCKLDQSKCY
jgi:hypothetical protein